jgi:restriction system protein
MLMAVPDFQTMMRPVLELHADGLPHTSADVRDKVAQVLDVTEEDRQVPLPSRRWIGLAMPGRPIGPWSRRT